MEYLSGFLFVILLSFIISLGLTPLMRKWARRLEVVDHPGERKVHTEAKPYLGGAAVFLAFNLTVVSSLVLFYLFQSDPWFARSYPVLARQLELLERVMPRLVALLAGGAIIFVVGLLDDILGPRLPAWVKLAGQALAAIVAVGSGVATQFMPYHWLNILISLIWVVGISNSFNFLDNMDGLCSGIAFVSGLIFLGVALLQGQLFMAFVILTLLGAAGGFLPFNFYPSTIFLGDAGSLFIGFLMACFTLLESYVTADSGSLLPVALPLIVLAVPLLDTVSVIYIRLREGRPVYVGDKNHLSHRLVRLGVSQRQAVLFLYLVTAALGLGALNLPYLGLTGQIVVLAQAIIIAALVSILMFYGGKAAGKE